ncbi:MAG: aminotransferase class I/II-fold pyridoxal phosphate-dependent enzyme [bacterium]
MTRSPVSRTVQEVMALLAPMVRWFTRIPELRATYGSEICDFGSGNPQEGAVEGYTRALMRWADPQEPDWFAYKVSEPRAQAVVAASLRDYLGIAFEPEDIALTNASIAALAVTLRTVCEPGDEVVIVSPPHFLYEPLIRAAGASAVRVKVLPETFDLDAEAVAGALTPRTRAMIVNTPHNPTGKIFPPETLQRLAGLLTEASERHQPVYLLSDEAYNRILFDDRPFTSPAAHYPRTFLIYSYGKVLLAPMQRIGYIAMHPRMPEREVFRVALMAGQIATGYAWPNALLQHALPDLDPLSVDLKRLQVRRDRMVDALRELGYELHVPEATFYLMPRSPIPDDQMFCEWLVEEKIIAMPGSFLDLPAYFRLSLTATDDMIDRSLPGFARAMKRSREVWVSTTRTR